MQANEEGGPTKEPKPPAHIARERNTEERRRKTLRSRFGGLEVIAFSLNTYRGEHATTSKEWELIENIVKAKSLPQKMKIFEEAADQYPVSLTVRDTDKSKTPAPGIASRDPQGDALKQLWWSYFRDSGWERLKQCSVCEQWFVDVSNNKGTLRCSPACTWTYWNRQRSKPDAPK